MPTFTYGSYYNDELLQVVDNQGRHHPLRLRRAKKVSGTISGNQTTTIYNGTGASKTVTLAGLVDDTFYYKVQACLSASQCSAWVEASTSGTYLQRKGGQNAIPATGSSTP